MKNIRCKGEKPASITIKVETENPIVNSMDVNKFKTKLERDITQQQSNVKEAQKVEKKPEDSDEEDHLQEVMTKPEGITQPKFKIVYSYPVGLEETWMAHEEILQKDRKLPVSMRVKIETPWMESIKDAILDINEHNLIFKIENLYNLDIKLKYLVDPDRGKAKFLKDKKVMEIDLPITGLT